MCPWRPQPQPRASLWVHDSPMGPTLALAGWQQQVQHPFSAGHPWDPLPLDTPPQAWGTEHLGCSSQLPSTHPGHLHKAATGTISARGSCMAQVQAGRG